MQRARTHSPLTGNREAWAVIPALDEEQGLPFVLAGLPPSLAGVVVADNGSRDQTAAVAESAGARVVHEPRRGYGAACMAGVAALPAGAGVVAFLDADNADDPSDLEHVLEPVLAGRADLVVGSRVLGRCDPGALPLHARLGNRLAVGLIRLLFGHRYTDLGPMRAVRREALEHLGMRERGFGWTVEMQVRALLKGLRVEEVPVSYRRRLGRSKITGTLWGTLQAGWKILGTIVALRLGAGLRRLRGRRRRDAR